MMDKLKIEEAREILQKMRSIKSERKPLEGSFDEVYAAGLAGFEAPLPHATENKDQSATDEPPEEFIKDSQVVHLTKASKEEFLKLSAFLKGIIDDG